MKSLKSLFAIAAATALCGSAGIAGAAPLFFDDFAQGNDSVTVTTSNTTAGSASASITGGTRQFFVHSGQLDLDGLDSIGTRVFIGGGGFFDYAESSGATGNTELAYQFSAPLAASPTDGVVFNFTNMDLPGTQIYGVINPGTDNYTTSTITLASGAQMATLPFATLPPGFNNISSIDLFITPPKSGDFRLTSLSVTAVPEPAMLGMIAVSLLALRRRRAVRD